MPSIGSSPSSVAFPETGFEEEPLLSETNEQRNSYTKANDNTRNLSRAEEFFHLVHYVFSDCADAGYCFYLAVASFPPLWTVATRVSVVSGVREQANGASVVSDSTV